MNLPLMILIPVVAFSFFSTSSVVKDIPDFGVRKNASDTCKKDLFKGLQEKNIVFKNINKNQGITNDGSYIYISPNHSTIEKRDIKSFELIKSAVYPDKRISFICGSQRERLSFRQY